MRNYCIIGAGKQGTAAAYDIVNNGDPDSITIIDSNKKNLEKCYSRINTLTGYSLNVVNIDIQNSKTLIKELENIDIFLSAVPYPLNPYLTEIAIKSKTSMVDLGGHTENVINQLKYSNEAKEAGISIVPDCGMGPGMNVSMALLAMSKLETANEVRVWDGGLPLDPIPPWNYNLFFNIQGLTNEYDGNAFFIRNKEVIEVPCFSDIEIIKFNSPINKLEAAVTSGGLSTMPWTFENQLTILENKTLRYPGHWDQMIAFRELGLFSEDPLEINDGKIKPRDFYHSLLEPKISIDSPKDICIMRTEAIGMNKGNKAKVIVECIEFYDNKTGFLAMEQWTGFHASMVMQHIINGKVDKGAYPIETALSGQDFYKYAIERGYKITIN